MKTSALLQLFCLFFFYTNASFGQLQFEAFLFKGYDTPFLDNASSIALSPDELHVYVTSFDDHAITLFNRDLNTGSLTYVEAYKNDIDQVAGLAGIHSVLVSPDGRHVYASGQSDNAISVFTRDPITGILQQVGLVINGINGINGLDGAFKLKSTKDGNYIFIVSPNNNTLSVFKRNVITGELKMHQQMKDGIGGVNDMTYPFSVSLSPNEKNVYVTSFGNNAITVFDRDISTGLLTFAGSVNGLTELNGAKGVEVSPDGKYVYVAAEQAIVVFNRMVSTGELTHLTTYSDGSISNYLKGIESMAFSKNGAYLLSASTEEDAISIFEINPNTGELTLESEVVNGQDGVSGLKFPVELALTPGGNQLYVAGFASNGLLHFGINDISGTIDFIDYNNTNSYGGLNEIGGAKDVCISPDGQHAYVAGELDDAITIFKRNLTTGEMTYKGKVEDDSSTDGLNGVNTIIASPDGAYIYAAGFWDHSVTIFERNPNSGKLTYLGRVKEGLFGTDGLSGVHDVILSADGQYLYTAGFLENGIGVFDRNTSNGMLTYQSVVKDGVLGVDGLSNVIDLALSPDGNYLYAAGNGEEAISIFERNADGSLSFVEAIKNTTPGVSGLKGITAISISPDGSQLYTCSEVDNAVVQFDRNIEDGTLTFNQKYQQGVSGDNPLGLDGASDIVQSANGQYIYVSAFESKAVTSFLRDTLSGDLEQAVIAIDGTGEINGIDGASSVNVSPDGKFIYATGFNDAAVSIFSCTIIKELQETICEGDTYLFGNDSLSTAGTYEHSTIVDGCTTIEKLYLEISPDSTVLSFTICNGDAVEVAGEEYMATGIYTHTLLSTSACDSTVVLDLTVVDAFPETELAKTICNGETYELGGTTFDESGLYEVSLTSGFGCDSTVVLHLNVLPLLVDTINITACTPQFYVFGNSNYIEDGTYTHTFTSENGCDSLVTMNLNFVPPSYTQAATICEDDAYKFGDQLLTNPGIYQGFITLSSGCEVMVELDLSVEPVAISETYIEICQGEFYVFNNSPYTASGQYSAYYPTGSLCDSIAYLYLTVHPTTILDLAASICEGESYVLGTNDFSETGVYEVSFESVEGCDSIVVLDLQVVPLAQEITDSFCQGGAYTFGNEVYTEGGTYVQMLLDSNGCEVTYTLNLEMQAVIEAEATIVEDDGAGIGFISVDNVFGGEAPLQYEWSTGDNTMMIAGLNTGDYQLTITDANGCYSIFTYTIEMMTGSVALSDITWELQILPNLISKGGDIQLILNSTSSKSIEILLTDNVGHSESLTHLQIQEGETRYRFTAPEVVGMYYVQIKSEEALKTLKFNVAY